METKHLTIRYILTCLILSFVINNHTTSAQSVLGVPFGTSIEEAKSILENRFGSYKVYKHQGGLLVHDVYVEDVEFYSIQFYFQYGNGKSYFNKAILQQHFKISDVKTAKAERDYLASILKKKYSPFFVEYTNEQGFKCYGFDSNPKEPLHYSGSLILEKSEGNDGVKRLYLMLFYDPISFIDVTTDF